jgi:hypothetical protein
MRELLARQARLATSSEKMTPQPKPTVQMSKEEILGLREACTDDDARPKIETSTEEARATRTTNLGLAPVQWRRPKTVVRPPPSTFLIVVVLALAGMLSLAVALLVLR